MLRLVMTSIFFLLISFGSIARNYQANVLLNHVSESHVSHSHGDHSHQDHHSDSDSKKSNNNENNHNHQLELNLLTQALHIESKLYKVLTTSLSFIDIQPLSSEQSLLISNYSFSIFRPPIA